MQRAIALGVVVMLVEYAFMTVLHHVLMPRFQAVVTEDYWDAVDALILTAVLSIAFYFLVFRELRDDEERLRKINDAALSAIVIVDSKARIAGWNAAAEKMFQFTTEEAIGQPMHDLIAPPRYHEDAARGFAHFEKTGGGPLLGKVTEIAARRKDGSEFPIELSLAAVELGQQRHAIGVINDISERKRAESVLRDSEERNRAIFDAVLDGIALADMETLGLVSANPALYRMLGYSPDELARLKVADLHPPQDWPHIQALFEKQASGEAPLAADVAVKRKDGSVFYADINAVPIHLGGKHFMLGVFRDTTEKKSTEARLGLFHRMIDQARDSIFLVDPATGRFLEANRTGCETLGYTREELLHLGVLDIQRDIQDAAAWQVHVQELKAQGSAMMEFDTLRRDGSRFPTEVGLRYAGNENSPGILAVVRDISQRKQMESLVDAQLAAIKRAQLDWASVFDSISQPIFLHDKDYRVIRANRAYAEQAGKPFADIIGQPYYAVFPPRDGPLSSCLRALQVEGEEAENIVVGEKLFHSRAFPVHDNQGAYLYSVHILDNITQRIQSDKALFASESRLHAILESTADGILAVDRQGNILKTNQRFADLWKMPPALIEAGDDQALLAHVLAQLVDSDAFLKQVEALYDSDANSLDLILFKDGRCYERFSSPMREGEAIIGRVWSFRDITARTQAEAQIAAQVLELKRWHDATVGCEARILELKDEVNQLLAEARQAPRYPSAAAP